MKISALICAVWMVTACMDSTIPGPPLTEDGAVDGVPSPDHSSHWSSPDTSPSALPHEPSTPGPYKDGAAPPPSSCASFEVSFQGYCYSATGYKWMDYPAAAQLCAANGGEVASIHSQAENQFVFGMMPPATQAAWIGLKRAGNGFTWADGKPASYFNWAPGEPNNEKSKENCAVIWGPGLDFASMKGKWNDVPCDAPGRDTVICKRKE